MSEPRDPSAVENWIAATFHGRTLLRAGDPARLLVGFHGYGENADLGMASLESLAAAKRWSLLAVQAPHVFYERKTGEVVANWMTRQGRDHAIADNIAYVAAAIDDARRALGSGVAWPTADPGGARIIVVGFSQGVAMAYRAVASGAFPVAGLVALAGDLPPELGAPELAGLPPVLIGRGTGEEWYTSEKLAADAERLRAAGCDPEIVEFEGGHEWTAAFRQRVDGFLARLGGAP